MVLPIDIVHEILLSLPVKTLLRFKSVSKQWYSLISQPSFQQHHFRRNSQQDPLLLLISIKDFNEVNDTTTLHLTTYNNHGESLVSEFSISVPHRFPYPLTTLSCRGLVCFFHYGGEQVLLCNPSTREIITLPPTSGSNHYVGFGYAASTEEFKVVRFFKHKDYHRMKTYCCEVFTLGGSGWREARCPLLQNLDTYIWGAPFLHGAIHFLPDIDNDNADIFIEAFDIESEECRKIHPPLSYHSVRDNPVYECMYVMELGGNLCLAFDFITTLELWLLKDYDSGEWVKEYTIDFTSLGSVVWGALRTMGDGRILMNIGFGMNNLLYWYNPWDKTFTQKTTEKYSTALYVENLLSPKALCNNIESSLESTRTGEMDETGFIRTAVVCLESTRTGEMDETGFIGTAVV